MELPWYSSRRLKRVSYNALMYAGALMYDMIMPAPVNKG